MPATVIAERIGWTRGDDGAQGPGRGSCGRCICRRIRRRGPSYLPGELAQCDLWFPPVDVPLGLGQAGRPPVLVMVCGLLADG